MSEQLSTAVNWWTCPECKGRTSPEAHFCAKCGLDKPDKTKTVVKAPKAEKKPAATIARKVFLDRAKPVSVKVAGSNLVAEPVEFSTGSFGWRLSGKTTVKVKGQIVSVMVNLNLTVPGSKEAP